MPTTPFVSTLALCPGAASVQTIWACAAFDSFLTLVTMFSILLILAVLGNVYHCSFENGLCRLGQLDMCPVCLPQRFPGMDNGCFLPKCFHLESFLGLLPQCLLTQPNFHFPN